MSATGSDRVGLRPMAFKVMLTHFVTLFPSGVVRVRKYLWDI